MKGNNKSGHLVVHRSVKVAPTHAFKVFTEHHGNWWPLGTHHIGTDPAQTVIIKQKEGGRWFERSNDGVECDWGRVLVWDPPNRIVLTWDIGADWKYDPKLGTVVDIKFKSIRSRETKVELEHRYLERFV